MKNRQFRVLLVAILLQPIIVYFRWGYRVEDIHYASNRENVQYMKDYLRNIDENVATVDGRMVWDIIPKIETLYDKSYGID